MAFDTIIYEEDGPIGTITLNRPDDGNMFTVAMCHEIRDCINEIRRETRTRAIVLTGAGDKFFCIGVRKEGMEKTSLYAGVLPTLEMYESIDRLQKPVIASVNGFAVGGGNVLQVVCDLTIAKESAVFRQVGPMMGSFDAGYGTWYLEDAARVDLEVLALEAAQPASFSAAVLDAEACGARATRSGRIIERMWEYLSAGDPELPPIR